MTCRYLPDRDLPAREFRADLSDAVDRRRAGVSNVLALRVSFSSSMICSIKGLQAMRALRWAEASSLKGATGAATGAGTVLNSSGISKSLDSLRYRAVGNAVCVKVIEWIGQRIVEVESSTDNNLLTI